MTKVIICGAFGRMGTTIAQMVMENPELEFVGGVDIRDGVLHGKPVVTSDKLGEFIDEAKPDVMIDFTVAAATMVNAKIAAAKGVALVIGTTGFTPEQDAELLDAIKNVPVVKTTMEPTDLEQPAWMNSMRSNSSPRKDPNPSVVSST